MQNLGPGLDSGTSFSVPASGWGSIGGLPSPPGQRWTERSGRRIPARDRAPGRASTQLGPAPVLRLPRAVSGHGSQAEDTRAGQRRVPEPALPLPASQASLDWIGVPTAPLPNVQLHFRGQRRRPRTPHSRRARGDREGSGEQRVNRGRVTDCPAARFRLRGERPALAPPLASSHAPLSIPLPADRSAPAVSSAPSVMSLLDIKLLLPAALGPCACAHLTRPRSPLAALPSCGAGLGLVFVPVF